jgi:hypothetical protein
LPEIDAHPIEELEVLGASAVGIDHLGADFSRRRVAVESHLPGFVVKPRILVGGVGVLAQVE